MFKSRQMLNFIDLTYVPQNPNEPTRINYSVRMMVQSKSI